MISAFFHSLKKKENCFFHNKYGKNSSIYFIGFLFLTTSLFLPKKVASQEIDFGQYSSLYSVSLAELNPALDLDFGMLVQNEGINAVSLINSKVLSITGVKYLDVIIDITAEDLYIDGNPSCVPVGSSCTLPFTLQAAYANNGNNDTNEATQITVLGNTGSAQFPILTRGTGPPGPPPTPVYEGYNPNIFSETAYIYIYGFVTVGNIDAGSYSSDITITVNYD